MGAAMGWTSQAVKAASMWEFFAAWHGYVEANTPADKRKMTAEEAEDLWEWSQRDQGVSGQLTTQTYWLDGDRLVPAGIVTFEVQ